MLYALEEPTIGRALRQRLDEPLGEDDLPAVLDLLAAANARAFAEEEVRSHHQQGLDALTEALGASALISPLGLLAADLLGREA